MMENNNEQYTRKPQHMSNKELLYKQFGALRLEIDASIVDTIVATANAAFAEQFAPAAPSESELINWLENQLTQSREDLSLLEQTGSTYTPDRFLFLRGWIAALMHVKVNYTEPTTNQNQ